MQNRALGLQIPLIFKTPPQDDDLDGQTILVTRKCSFDMAFYQLAGKKLVV